MAVTNIVTRRGKQQFNGLFNEIWAVSFKESANVAPATQTSVTSTVTVPGVKFGDAVIAVSLNVNRNSMMVGGYVSGVDTVTIEYSNNTGSTITLVTPTVNFVVARPNFV